LSYVQSFDEAEQRCADGSMIGTTAVARILHYLFHVPFKGS